MNNQLPAPSDQCITSVSADIVSVLKDCPANKCAMLAGVILIAYTAYLYHDYKKTELIMQSTRCE